jgi:hypothetical protein
MGNGPAANNPNNPWVSGQSLDPAITADLDSGNFSGAFTSALGQNTSDDPGMSQLQELLTPGALSASGVNWDQSTMDAYYNALNANAPAIQKNDQNIIQSVGDVYNPQIASGNGGNSQFNGGTFGKTDPTVTNGNYVPDPLANDYSPQFQNGHMGGVLGDVTNAVGAAVPVVADASIIAGLAAAGGIGAGALAGEAGAGALGTAVATGAGTGAVGSAAGDTINGIPLTLGSVGKGALIGGVTGGLGYAATPITNSLTTSLGVSPTVASGLVKGTIGAGVGALGSEISGGNAGNGALVGGLGGAASGLVSGETGSAQLGSASGTIAGALASKYLTTPTAPAAAAAPKPVAAPTPTPAPTAAPAQANIQPIVSTPTATSGAPAANIGAYSGYGGAAGSGTTGLGYAPYTQTGPVANPYTYAQGPEQAMFTSANGPA